MLGEAPDGEASPLQGLLQSIATAAAEHVTDPAQETLFVTAASGLVALACSYGREDVTIAAAAALACLADATRSKVLVSMPPIAVALERSVRCALDPGGAAASTSHSNRSTLSHMGCCRQRLGVPIESPLPNISDCNPGNLICRCRRCRSPLVSSRPSHTVSVCCSLPDVASDAVCFAYDGQFLYTASAGPNAGVHKLAANGARPAKVYAHANSGFSVSGSAWIGLLGDFVLLRPDAARPGEMFVLETEELRTVETIKLLDRPCSLFVSCEVLNMVEVVSELPSTEFEEPQPEVAEPPAELELWRDKLAASASTSPSLFPLTPINDGLTVADAASVKRGAGDQPPKVLVATPVLRLDEQKRVVAASGPPRKYELGLNGLVLHGRDRSGLDYGCQKTMSVTSDYAVGAKFKAGDKIMAKKK